MIDWESLVAFLGVLLAVLMRSLLPYVRRVKEAVDKGGDIPSWSQRYTVTGLFAFFTSLAVALLSFSELTLPAEPTSLVYVFAVSFGYGWGVNDVYNKVFVDWL
jgi:multisubunit Na+/H+ antiporter MnhB subunit